MGEKEKFDCLMTSVWKKLKKNFKTVTKRSKNKDNYTIIVEKKDKNVCYVISITAKYDHNFMIITPERKSRKPYQSLRLNFKGKKVVKPQLANSPIKEITLKNKIHRQMYIDVVTEILSLFQPNSIKFIEEI